MIDLPSQTVLIVGVGGAGSEASKLCAALGMRVLGADPARDNPPPGMGELSRPIGSPSAWARPISSSDDPGDTGHVRHVQCAALLADEARRYFINIARAGAW